ncbi:MAG: hypothetical protein ACI3W5_09520 [Faecousia sp.]
MEEQFNMVAKMVLQKLEAYLRTEEHIDPQKCKHITATLKDIKDLQSDNDGPKQLVVVFDPAAEEAAM